MPQETTMTCAHCKTQFRGNPQSQPLGRDNYCSIACEEGRGSKSPEDPSSPEFPRFVQGEPTALVGYHLVASGLKHVNYSPHWTRDPDAVNPRALVDVDEGAETYVRTDSFLLGYVEDYQDGEYVIRFENADGETDSRRRKDSDVLHQLKTERWWAE